jgi:HK97 family phage major capsid protein
MNVYKRSPILLIAVVLASAAFAAHAGYIDPASLLATTMLVPFGMTASVSNVALYRGALAKRASLIDAMNKITASVPTDGSLTAEQQTQLDAHLATMAGLDGDIKRVAALIEAERSVDIKGALIETRPNVLDDPRRGFKNFGDFAHSVRVAVVGGDVDDRLRPQAATPGATFGNENVGVDGGYLVPTDFAMEITKLGMDHDAFLPRCDALPISGNSMTFPSDETTPWGTNGVRAYWASEAAAATATKPVIKPNTMRLNKLFALCPVTDELMADAPAMSAYLTSLMARSIKWKANDAVINGTGAGQPLGILNAGALVVIAKEGGQAANTLAAANIAKMFAAMPADYLGGAEWLITPDALPALITLTLGNYPLWVPPTAGFQGAPGGFLLGKPVNISQTCAAFSSQGDIVFTNFKAYRTISKDGVQIAQSMHLYFDADSTAFRATFRVDGQPTLKQSIAQARGAQALSPYVTLQAR